MAAAHKSTVVCCFCCRSIMIGHVHLTDALLSQSVHSCRFSDTPSVHIVCIYSVQLHGPHGSARSFASGPIREVLESGVRSDSRRFPLALSDIPTHTRQTTFGAARQKRAMSVRFVRRHTTLSKGFGHAMQCSTNTPILSPPSRTTTLPPLSLQTILLRRIGANPCRVVSQHFRMDASQRLGVITQISCKIRSRGVSRRSK
jgi:hypothetical protein